MIILLQSALAVQVCPPETVGQIVGCKTLQQAIEQAPRDVTTVLDMEPGVYRSAVTVSGNRTFIIEGDDSATFAASASDPRMDGRIAQFEVRDGLLDIRSSTLAPVNLGAVYVDAGNGATITRSAIAPSGAGWGLWLQGATGEVRQSLFVGGVAFTGAHALLNGSTLDVFNSQFVGGVATTSGGSIQLGLDAVLNIEDSSFSGNQAASGGAIAVYGGRVEAVRVSFQDNRATFNGGAVELHAQGGGELHGEFLVFDENTALNGGAVHLGSGQGEIRVSSFCQNAATEAGGAVHTGTSASPAFTNVRFLDNVASRGGAMALQSPDVEIGHANFLGNRASNKGAAVYASEAGGGRVYRSLFAYSSGAVAVITEAEAPFSVWNTLHYRNEVGNLGLGVVDRNNPIADPLLRGYLPGQACGLINDLHAFDSPLRTIPNEMEGTATGEIPGDPTPTCQQPIPEDGALVFDSVPDWGAYGGACGFGELAWRNGDEDFTPAIYDCDDADPTIGPSAPEIWYDGIDQNCDGGDDYDQDGDGYQLGFDDCDDRDADINRFADDDDPFRDLDCDDRIEDIAPVLTPESIACETGVGGYMGGIPMVLALFWRRGRALSAH